MKKFSIALAFALIMIVSAVSAGANENGEADGINDTNQSQAADYRIMHRDLAVNGQKLPDFPLTINSCTLVPAKAVCDALGFKIKWNASDSSAVINSDAMEMKVVVGQDLYSAHSTIAIGMTKPVPLGSSPILVNDKLYVPVQIFRILQGNDPDAVQFTDSQIIVNKID